MLVLPRMRAKALGLSRYASCGQRSVACANPQDLYTAICLREISPLLGCIRREAHHLEHQVKACIAYSQSLPQITSFVFLHGGISQSTCIALRGHSRKHLSLKATMWSRRWRQGSVWIQSPNMIEHDLRFHFAFSRQRDWVCKRCRDLVVAMWRQESVRVQSANMI